MLTFNSLFFAIEALASNVSVKITPSSVTLSVPTHAKVQVVPAVITPFFN